MTHTYSHNKESFFQRCLCWSPKLLLKRKEKKWYTTFDKIYCCIFYSYQFYDRKIYIEM